MKKLFVVGGDIGYANWIQPIGFQITSDATKANAFLFTGGEDVNPALYNEPVGRHTYYSYRDAHEITMFNYAKERNLPMFGTCRGLQFLTVMSGGKLVQDVSHPGFHPFHTNTGETLPINSLHHQMALVDPNYTNLKEDDYELIGWTDRLSHSHLNGNDQDYQFPSNFKEPEVVFFPKTKSWGVQGHPEMLFRTGKSEYKQTIGFLQDSIKKCFNYE
jgi:putative glutamine amidotransferase